MRWLGLFRNKTFRKHLKLIFPHWDFIISIVSLEIFHPYFVIRIFPSAFFYPPSAIRHPPSAAIRSALYRDPWKKLFPLLHKQTPLTNTVKWRFSGNCPISTWKVYFLSSPGVTCAIFSVSHCASVKAEIIFLLLFFFSSSWWSKMGKARKETTTIKQTKADRWEQQVSKRKRGSFK